MDVISMICLMAECVFLGRAQEYCDESYTRFYEVAMALQFFVLIRLFLFCVHFTRKSKPFYKWLKRKFVFLQSVEGEQRLTLDVYKLPDYIQKI